MIRTNCAACATPLAHTAPRCGDCHTRYCGRGCQKQHWKAGHKKDCKKIKRGGGAEQYYADKKCAEAVAVAVEACVDDTKGQTCYICLEAVHPRTGEGLVRGCACGDREGVDSGTTGIAHVSCLAEQAKVLFAEAVEKKLGVKEMNKTWTRWYSCSLCEQRYHGVVYCALGWACWKTYLSRTERDKTLTMAMNVLGAGLHAADHNEDELSVREAELSTLRRIGVSERSMLVVQANLATTYHEIGRFEESRRLRQDVYSGLLKLFGEEHEETLGAANNYASSLFELERFEEAKSLLRKMVPVARRVFGDSIDMTLMRRNYAAALYKADGATLDDLREAVTTLEDTARITRRVLGDAHPLTVDIEDNLQDARAALRAREEPSSGAP
jgi:tetratricopeptide (TPR) repeat protein